MCQILLVDDELLTIQAIEQNIDWDSCGITRVFLSDNVSQAKELLKKEAVTMVISDIEMPGEDGISFVSWIRREQPWTPVFFLTGFAEFEYAKAAVSLQAEDYILKPVNYHELEEKIRGTLKKVERKRQEGQMQRQYALHRDELYGEWIRYILSSAAEPSQEEIICLVERFHLDFTVDCRYLLVRLRLQGKEELSWEYLEKRKQELVKALEGRGRTVYAANFQEGRLDLCVKYREETLEFPEEMRESLAHLTAGWETACCCFVSEPVRVEQIVPMIRKIADRDGRNVLYQNRLILVGLRNIPVKERGETVDDRKWRELLENRQFERLISAIDFSLRELMISKQMDRESLRMVYNHFMQLMYHYIGENFTQREVMLQDGQIGELQKKALNSVEDFRNFMRLFLERMQQNLMENDENQMVAEVKKYIEEHLTERISRAQVAEHVALNENYLSRLFHQEMGLSISDYILQKRIVLAKKLLVQTDRSVSEIGNEVGYDATAYFIRLFKREVGKTPKEYRKDMRI